MMLFKEPAALGIAPFSISRANLQSSASGHQATAQASRRMSISALHEPQSVRSPSVRSPRLPYHDRQKFPSNEAMPDLARQSIKFDEIRLPPKRPAPSRKTELELDATSRQPHGAGW